jgi:hypothetical protein
MAQWRYTKEIRVDFDNFILDKDTHYAEMKRDHWAAYTAGYKEKADAGEVFPDLEIFPIALAFRNEVGDLIHMSESSHITNFTRISIFMLTHNLAQANDLKEKIIESFMHTSKNIILERAEITEVDIPIDPTLAFPVYGHPYIGEKWDKYNYYNYQLTPGTV